MIEELLTNEVDPRSKCSIQDLMCLSFRVSVKEA
jgi:hypothetical protein